MSHLRLPPQPQQVVLGRWVPWHLRPHVFETQVRNHGLIIFGFVD